MSSSLKSKQTVRSRHGREDSILWKQFKEGDYQAFQEIYCLYLDELFNYGFKVVPKAELVKDCIHDLFVDLWTRKQKLSDTNHIKYYLFKALRRKIIRLEINNRKSQNGVDDFQKFSEVGTIEDRIIESERDIALRIQLSKALASLPHRQREALSLLYYEEFSYDMVANIMGINLKSVYNLACKAISTLRKKSPRLG